MSHIELELDVKKMELNCIIIMIVLLPLPHENLARDEIVYLLISLKKMSPKEHDKKKEVIEFVMIVWSI